MRGGCAIFKDNVTSFYANAILKRKDPDINFERFVGHLAYVKLDMCHQIEDLKKMFNQNYKALA